MELDKAALTVIAPLFFRPSIWGVDLNVCRKGEMEDQVQTETQPGIPVEQTVENPANDWLKFDTDFDFKGTRKYDELAVLMPVGASKGGLSRADAVGLAAAIERAHGKRTASTFKVDSAFRVQRTEPKAPRNITRQPKPATEGSTDKKATTKKGGK